MREALMVYFYTGNEKKRKQYQKQRSADSHRINKVNQKRHQNSIAEKIKNFIFNKIQNRLKALKVFLHKNVLENIKRI